MTKLLGIVGIDDGLLVDKKHLYV